MTTSLDYLKPESSFISAPSSDSKGLVATAASAYVRSQLGTLHWSGSANSRAIISGKATFIIRAYLVEGRVARSIPTFTRSVTAKAEHVTTVNGIDWYYFQYDFLRSITLEQGTYLFSIVDPETNDLNFNWHIAENNIAGLYTGGGMKKPGGDWEPLCVGGTFYSCRGFSLSIRAYAIPQELPIEMVSIPDTNIRMSKFEITRGQFARFAIATGYSRTDWLYALRQEDSHPVVAITWNEIQDYLKWLNDTEKPSKPYRLPTEAEWLHAARGGKTTEFYWGNEMQAGVANCIDSDCVDTFVKTSPVGSFPPNDYGLYDVLGNVNEWLQDCYNPTCNSRLFRGGSWAGTAWELKFSTPAYAGLPDEILFNFGFRLAQDK